MLKENIVRDLRRLFDLYAGQEFKEKESTLNATATMISSWLTAAREEERGVWEKRLEGLAEGIERYAEHFAVTGAALVEAIQRHEESRSAPMRAMAFNIRSAIRSGGEKGADVCSRCQGEEEVDLANEDDEQSDWVDCPACSGRKP